MGGRFVIWVIALGALTSTAAALDAWTLGGTFECSGRPAGSQHSAKVNCSQEQTRGRMIYTSVFTFTIQGPAAKSFMGKHDKCWHVEAKDTRFKKHVITCPGVPKWW